MSEFDEHLARQLGARRSAEELAAKQFVLAKAADDRAVHLARAAIPPIGKAAAAALMKAGVPSVRTKGLFRDPLVGRVWLLGNTSVYTKTFSFAIGESGLICPDVKVGFKFSSTAPRVILALRPFDTSQMRDGADSFVNSTRSWPAGRGQLGLPAGSLEPITLTSINPDADDVAIPFSQYMADIVFKHISNGGLKLR